MCGSDLINTIRLKEQSPQFMLCMVVSSLQTADMFGRTGWPQAACPARMSGMLQDTSMQGPQQRARDTQNSTRPNKIMQAADHVLMYLVFLCCLHSAHTHVLSIVNHCIIPTGHGQSFRLFPKHGGTPCDQSCQHVSTCMRITTNRSVLFGCRVVAQVSGGAGRGGLPEDCKQQIRSYIWDNHWLR